MENIKILADTFHIKIEENSIVENLQRIGDKLSHFHFRDSNSLAPGFGHIDFKSIIRISKDIDFSGFCSIESISLSLMWKAVLDWPWYILNLWRE